MNNKPLERLQWIRKQAELNAKEFAYSIGLSPSGYHTMLSRGSKVSRVLANSVELIHGIRAEWILTGEGLQQVDARRRLDDALKFFMPSAKKASATGALLIVALDKYLQENPEYLDAVSKSLLNLMFKNVERNFG